MARLPLSDLWVSQCDLRHPADRLWEMIGFVERGGLFSQDSIHEWSVLNGERPHPPLVSVNRFEDGLLMVHNGHNRATCILLGGREFLDPCEYFVQEIPYSKYDALEPHNDWFTPFHPACQVRLADFFDFKAEARRIYRENPRELAVFVASNHHLYCASRDLNTVGDMASRVAGRLKGMAVPGDLATLARDSGPDGRGP